MSDKCDMLIEEFKKSKTYRLRAISKNHEIDGCKYSDTFFYLSRIVPSKYLNTDDEKIFNSCVSNKSIEEYSNKHNITISKVFDIFNCSKYFKTSDHYDYIAYKKKYKYIDGIL